MKLRQYVFQTHVSHGEMCVLRRPNGNEPRAAGYVRSLGNEQESAILRVFPEGLRPIDGDFLNGAVLDAGVSFIDSAESDNRFGHCW